LDAIVPIPVRVVESDQVTFRQLAVELVLLHPGLLTVATNENVSPVPTVAEVGVRLMLIPVTIVRVAAAVLLVSACAVAVIVTVGAIVVVPLDVTVGIVAGAVYSPVASIVPHVFTATPVAQANVQVMAVLLEPVTAPLKSCVRLVITLALVGETVMATVEELLPPQPKAPSAAARVSIVDNFHHLIPVLPISLIIRPHCTRSKPVRQFDFEPAAAKAAFLLPKLRLCHG
jgi:hypothetical protein